MSTAIKETTPVEYSNAAVKRLHFSVHEHKSCFNLHWHDRIEIILVKKGKLKVDSYRKSLELKAGEMMVFTPRMSHKGYTEDCTVEYDVLMFDVRMFYNQTAVCNQFFTAIFEGKVLFENIISDKETLSCTEQICTSEDENSLEIVYLIYKLLHLLFENNHYKTTSEFNAKIKPIIDYIEDNYMLDINTTYLSKNFGYSSEHFCRKFKEAIGITPMTYLKICRLEHALKLIKEDKCNIGEVALQCGFYDANYFSRCFKSYYGVPPRHYKGKG